MRLRALSLLADADVRARFFGVLSDLVAWVASTGG